MAPVVDIASSFDAMPITHEGLIITSTYDCFSFGTGSKSYWYSTPRGSKLPPAACFHVETAKRLTSLLLSSARSSLQTGTIDEVKDTTGGEEAATDTAFPPTKRRHYLPYMTPNPNKHIEEQLPSEVLDLVFKRMDPEDAIQASHVNQRWRKAATDETLWKHLIMRMKKEHKWLPEIDQEHLKKGYRAYYIEVLAPMLRDYKHLQEEMAEHGCADW
eukprot:Clim_evm29s204 gene=Clim_evmTU29s204